MSRTLVFNFHTITTAPAVDALVYAISLQLFLNNRIESFQTSCDTLEFETSAHCLLAQLSLAADSRFTVTCV